MVLRLLACNAEHWLSGHLNAYLATTTNTAPSPARPSSAASPTITITPAAITLALEPPGEPRVARALALLIEEINATPPAMPGDSRPITYHLAPRQAFNPSRSTTSGDLGRAHAVHPESFVEPDLVHRGPFYSYLIGDS